MKPSHVPPPDNNRRIKNLCATVFCRLLLLCYIVWSVCLLVMQPKPPNYMVESGTVELNLEGSKVTGQWDVTLLGTNPNRYFNIYYKRVRAGILYRTWDDYTHTLVKKRWPYFVTSKRNQTRVELKFSVLQDERGYELVDSSVSVVRIFSSSVWFVSKLLLPEHARLLVDCKVPHDNGIVTFTSEYSGECSVLIQKTYVYEALVICSYIVIAVWACSKPRQGVAPS